MTYLVSGTAFCAALAIAAPVWAQALTTQDLNRQELNRLAAAQVAPPQVVITDPVGLSVADGVPGPAYPRFPGLLNLAGLVLGGSLYVTGTVLVGLPGQE